MAGGNTETRPVGRPSVITPEVLRKLEEAFAIGASDREACFYADIGTTALYQYQQEHPEFTERKEALKERPILLARQTVVKALDSDPDLSLKYLERKRKDEFSVKKEVDNTVTADITSNGNTVGQPDPSLSAGFADYLKAQTEQK